MAFLSEELSTTAPGQGPLYERLRELGWVYGQNIVTERRAYGDQMERIPELAAELIRSGVDIFIVPGGVGAVRVQQVTPARRAPRGSGYRQQYFELARPGPIPKYRSTRVTAPAAAVIA